MKRLFISHSTIDEFTVQQFNDFLIAGMGVAHNDIYCTIHRRTISPGTPFLSNIKESLSCCHKIICLITPSYLHSRNCMGELGAAWFQNEKIIPIIVPPATFSDLNNTPLLGTQALCANSRKDLAELYDVLKDAGIAQNLSTSEFNRQLDKYIDILAKPQLIKSTGDKHYCAAIEAIRYASPNYRCYKLNGLLELDEEISEDETHWLFYRTGMYEDLRQGDYVSFSVSSTAVRDFPDLKNARNIYPNALKRI